MSETGSDSNELTITQLRNILNHDHIHKHLIQTGYIDKQGNVVRKNSQLQNSQNRQSCAPFLNKNPPKTNHRLKSASSSQTRRTNKTKSSTQNQSTNMHNVLLRRAVSPKLLFPAERCIVTLKYIGSDLNIDYDRSYFEPEGDEILLLQQHCGGENLPVVKGFYRPNDTFTFASRRHTDYPFAFAFYLNGVIKDRLSVCCESRCENYTPVGGKKALIAIIKTENARPCRRCRYEQRIQKLTELEKSQTRENFIKKNIERNASKSPVHQPNKSKSSSIDKENRSSTPDQSKVSSQHQSPPVSSKNSSAESPPPVRKRSPTNNKSTFSHKRTQKISSPQEISSGSSSPEPPTIRKKSPTNNKPNFSHKRTPEISSPREISSDDSSPPPPPSRPPASSLPKNSSPQPISSGASTPERTTSNKVSSPPLTVINGKSSYRNLASDEEQTNRSSSVNNNNNTDSNSPQPTTYSSVSTLVQSKNKSQNLTNPPHISTEDESDGDVVSISDESPSETKRSSHRRNFSD